MVWPYLQVFIWVFLLELAFVEWVKAIEQRRAFRAAFESGIIAVLSISSVIAVVDDYSMMIPAVLGHMVGSYLGVVLDGDEDSNSEGPGDEAEEDGGGPGDTWRLLSHYGTPATLTDGGRPSVEEACGRPLSPGGDQRGPQGDGAGGGPASQVHSGVLRHGVSEDWPAGVDL